MYWSSFQTLKKVLYLHTICVEVTFRCSTQVTCLPSISFILLKFYYYIFLELYSQDGVTLCHTQITSEHCQHSNSRRLLCFRQADSSFIFCNGKRSRHSQSIVVQAMGHLKVPALWHHWSTRPRPLFYPSLSSPPHHLWTPPIQYMVETTTPQYHQIKTLGLR